MHARRILHCCWCCDDLGAATAWLGEGLGLPVVLATGEGRRDGAILGLAREIETRAAFVFDARGPRTSPAVEVSAWIDPPASGAPYATPNHVGIQALGVTTPDLAASLAAAEARGSRAVSAPAASPLFGARAACLRDASGVAFDLVEASGASPRLRHLRVTCRDLARSIAWYERIGFAAAAPRAVEIAAGTLGQRDAASLRVAALALPDEPTAMLLTQWLAPISEGAPYAAPHHRGLYRIALAVDDTRAALSALEREGVRAERPAQCVTIEGTRVPPMWIAFLRDPDGIPIELVERPRSAFR